MGKRALLLLITAPVLASAFSGSVRAAATGCTPAPIHHGPPPPWTAPAWADSSPGFERPYALASGDAAAAFFFGPDLRAGHPVNPSNKVLWVVHYPRNGSPLRVLARWGPDPSIAVHLSFADNAEPGEIYPSEVDLPRAGCWRLTLHWSTHSARIDMKVHPLHG